MAIFTRCYKYIKNNRFRKIANIAKLCALELWQSSFGNFCRVKTVIGSDLAELYDVPTWNVTRAVSRNIERFPKEFMFELSKHELEDLKRHNGVSSSWGGRRRSIPRAFTQEGVAMLSGVLTSKQAVQVNILIMKTLCKTRGDGTGARFPQQTDSRHL